MNPAQAGHAPGITSSFAFFMKFNKNLHWIQASGYKTFDQLPHINCIVTRWPDRRCLSHGMCFYQVVVMMHFLNDVVNEF